MLSERMGELAEEAERERALKDVTDATARDKGKAAEGAKKKAQSSKKARLLAEKRSTELETKLWETELKLAQAESLNLAHVEEVAELKAALEACENKWYNEGFANAKNSVEPVVHQARVQAFEEGWLATLQALGVLKNSPLRNLEQISRPTLAILFQSQVEDANDEDTPSMRELVKAINTHVESVDLEITSNFNAPKNEGTQQLPTEDAPDQLADDEVQFFPTDLAT